MQYQAAIFDMDGLLVDSEPLWQKAEISVFQQLGVPLNTKMCEQTMGLRIDEVSEYWRQRYPWEHKSDQEVAYEVIDKLIKLIPTHATLLPGVHEALAYTKQSGLHIALASSSPLQLINCFLENFGLLKHFEIIHSAECEEYGKPHPATYLTTAQRLGIHPTQCIAIEDSFRGLIAAKSARMFCIVVPDSLAQQDPRWVIADKQFSSLLEMVRQGFPKRQC